MITEIWSSKARLLFAAVLCSGVLVPALGEQSNSSTSTHAQTAPSQAANSPSPSQQQVKTIQDELTQLFIQSRNATIKERHDAMDAWRKANGAKLEILRKANPQFLDSQKVSAATSGLGQTLRQLHQQHASPTAIRAAAQQWRTNNADTLNTLRKSVPELTAAKGNSEASSTPASTGTPGNPNATTSDVARKEFFESLRQVHEQTKGATAAQKQQAMAVWRQQHTAILAAIRQQRPRSQATPSQ